MTPSQLVSPVVWCLWTVEDVCTVLYCTVLYCTVHACVYESGCVVDEQTCSRCDVNTVADFYSVSLCQHVVLTKANRAVRIWTRCTETKCVPTFNITIVKHHKLWTISMHIYDVCQCWCVGRCSLWTVHSYLWCTTVAQIRLLSVQHWNVVLNNSLLCVLHWVNIHSSDTSECGVWVTSVRVSFIETHGKQLPSVTAIQIL